MGARYLLTLLPQYRPLPNAPVQVPSGWGWVDDRQEGLAAAMCRHNVHHAGRSIWRRTDGVMVSASDAASGCKLMTLVNQTVAVGAAHYCSVHRQCDGSARAGVHSLPIAAQAAEQVISTQPREPSPQAPRPLTVYGGPLKRSLTVCLRPNSLPRSTTPPPEGPRKRLQRFAAVDTALLNMGEAILRLQQDTLTLKDTLQDLRRLS